MFKAFEVHWLDVVHKGRKFYLRGNFILIYLNIEKNINNRQVTGPSCPKGGNHYPLDSVICSVNVYLLGSNRPFLNSLLPLLDSVIHAAFERGPDGYSAADPG